MRCVREVMLIIRELMATVSFAMGEELIFSTPRFMTDLLKNIGLVPDVLVSQDKDFTCLIFISMNPGRSDLTMSIWTQTQTWTLNLTPTWTRTHKISMTTSHSWHVLGTTMIMSQPM